jgi:2-deoxy-D-gluconate 3-dehydrogenase
MEESKAFERFSLRDRVAIITGGAGFLGVHYCQSLAEFGAHVVVADLDEQAPAELAERVTESTEVEALGLSVDVSNPESVLEMVRATMDKFNRIDILVNNAALDPKFDSEHSGEHTNRFEDFPFEMWQQALDVNITGMYLCAQAVSRPMLEANRGLIVNVSSTYGIVGPDQRLYEREGEAVQFKPVTYTVTKSAVLGLTKYLAAYFHSTGIRVNTLTPGGVFAGHDEEFVRRYSDKTILGRMAEPEDMCGALLFLVSDASSYMTGANLVVDGGWTAW